MYDWLSTPPTDKTPAIRPWDSLAKGGKAGLELSIAAIVRLPDKVQMARFDTG